MRPRIQAGLLAAHACLLVSWALVNDAGAQQPQAAYQVIVRTAEVEKEREPWPEPDKPPHLTDEEWAEFERQSECLWRLMRGRDMPITLETVTAADVWAEHNGGACHLIGEDDE